MNLTGLGKEPVRVGEYPASMIQLRRKDDLVALFVFKHADGPVLDCLGWWRDSEIACEHRAAQITWSEVGSFPRDRVAIPISKGDYDDR